MELRPEEITKIIRSQIKNYEAKLESSETGIVILVGDGIARVSGLDKCMAGELIEFPNGSYGMAQNLEEDTVSVVILGTDSGIKEGDTVKRTGRVVSVPVGSGMIGRVVNALVKSAVLGLSGSEFSLFVIFLELFTGTWAGILLQLVIIPPLVVVLEKFVIARKS